MYFATSKDILFIVLAFAVLWLAIFLSWTLYYLIGILRDARKTVAGLKRAAESIENAMSHIKTKFEALINIASVVSDTVRGFMSSRDDHGSRKKR